MTIIRTALPHKKRPRGPLVHPVVPPPRPGNYPTNPHGGASGPVRPPGFGPPPGPITTAEQIPDYEGLIKADAGYNAWGVGAAARERSAALKRASALRMLAFQYGGLPSGATDAYGDLSQTDFDAARGNQFSQLSLLNRNYDQSVRDMRRSLAARGALQSGELGYGQEQTDFGRAAQENQYGSDFQAQLQDLLNSYTGVTSGIETERPGEIAAAQGRVAEAYKPTPAGKATFIVGSRAKYGYALYRDKAGKVWRIDPTTNKPTLWQRPA